MGYGLDSREISLQFPAGQEIFLFSRVSRLALEHTQPPIQGVPETLSAGVKQPGPQADHLPPSSAKVKNVWSSASAPPCVFIVWCLIN
jgi:hypothetical protein